MMTFLKNQRVHQDQKVTLLKVRLMKNESNINFIKRKSRQEEMPEGENLEDER